MTETAAPKTVLDLEEDLHDLAQLVGGLEAMCRSDCGEAADIRLKDLRPIAALAASHARRLLATFEAIPIKAR